MYYDALFIHQISKQSWDYYNKNTHKHKNVSQSTTQEKTRKNSAILYFKFLFII